MKLLRRAARARAKTLRPAERYLALGADEARRRGHGYIGTEHVLVALAADPEGRAARILAVLGVRGDDLERSRCLRELWPPAIDADALAALGVDLDAVRAQMETTFGEGALDRTGPDECGPRAQCIAPRLKMALAYAVDRAAGERVRDEHILLGMLSVPDCLAARALGELGVTLTAVEAVVREVR
jgi:ATP-dependent Clp protease ATP-binding subunit ClpA